ncbi:ophiophagus venom factor-like isoform X2 [Acanthaster planci]|uniref:Ophiophagus venom factor-like isoform X2 n=1 Tax=Acanthaster planci TaxID=133434 RepID=A0A8B7ZVZ6_ACAPL|nr:ophiophagus venom factor-like isoform X2 [Acanthaster planci]
MVKVCLLVVCAVVQLLVAAQAAQYFIVAPNVVRVAVEETILVSVRGTGANQIPVTLYFQVAWSTDRISERTILVTENEPQVAVLTIHGDQLPELPTGGQQFVTLVATANSAQLTFQDLRPILLSYQAGFAFIQTDKPLYTPKQDVNIRVVTLDQNMAPMNDELGVDIINPDGLTVERNRRRPNGGFMTHFFSLPPNPVLGSWTVTAYYGHQFKSNSSIQFEVKEYVLSKFYVEVTPHSMYIVPGTENLVSRVTARYMFGEPVVGNFYVIYGVFEDDGSLFKLQSKEGRLNEEGRADQDLDLGDLEVVNWAEILMGKRLIIQAFVTDRASGETVNANNTMVTFSPTPYTFNWDLTQRYFKPGLSFTVKACIRYMNGLPADGVRVIMSATATRQNGANVNLPGGYADDASRKLSGPQGQLDFTLNMPADTTMVSVSLETDEPYFVDANTRDTIFIQPQFPNANREYMVVRLPSQDIRQTPQIGWLSSVEAQLTHPQNVDVLNYFVIAGGRIVHKGVKDLVNLNTALDFMVTHDMAPSARVVAYYIKDDGHVVADALLIDVEEKCKNPIDLRFKGLVIQEGDIFKSDRPRQNIELEIRGQAETKVGLLAVDEAVFKLRNSHRLTQKKVFKRMAEYDLGCGPGGGQDSASILKDAGVTVLTNANLDIPYREALGCTAENRRVQRSTSVNKGEQILREFESISRGRSSVHDASWVNLQAVSIQSAFPESWMFEEVELLPFAGETGETLHRSTLPDSVTTWVIEAVAVSADFGLCVANPIKLEVRPPFFLDLSMPYSVLRFEQIEIVATVFNYADRPFEVSVYLKGKDGLCSVAQPEEYSDGTLIEVTPSAPASVKFVIMPLEVKDIPIEIVAVDTTGVYQNGVVKHLTVRPEGTKKEVVVPLTLDPANSRGSQRSERVGQEQHYYHMQNWKDDGGIYQVDFIQYIINKNAIPGTHRVRMSLFGKVQGSVVETVIGGVDNLLMIPTGNGEETMMRLGPNVYVYTYLKSTYQISANLETSSMQYIVNGVARELTFRLSDGSFFALASSFQSSTWLTAFVAKVFCQAKEFAFIDDGIICMAMEWLITRSQSPDDGSFRDVYRVLDREMTGGVQGKVSLTAYVLISLLECQCDTFDKDSSVAAAATFLEAELEELTRPYAIAITAYALALANSSRVQDAIRMLKDIATHDEASDSRYWAADDSSFGGGSKPYWYSRRPKAIEVETTSYALLALLTVGDIQYTHAIVKWLTNQENYHGGFVSSQDTVMALQALSVYAYRVQELDIDFFCTVTCDESNYDETFRVNADNALVPQVGTINIPNNSGEINVFVTTEGTGIGQFKFEASYYIAEPNYYSCDFELQANVGEVAEEDQLMERELFSYDIRVRYLRGEKSGMAILVVGLFTGYVAVEEDLRRVTANSNGRVQRYETTEHSVVFYFEDVPRLEAVDIQFRAERLFHVGRVQPVAIRVRNFYNSKECVKFVSRKEGYSSIPTFCEGDTCVCAAGKCAREPARSSKDYSVYEMTVRACASEAHFAYKVRVDAVVGKGDFELYNMTILEPLKRGIDEVLNDDVRVFVKSKGCDTPKFRLQHTYLVIGTGGLPAKDMAEYAYTYLIDGRMYFYTYPTADRVRTGKWRRINQKLVELERQMEHGACRS